MKSSLLSLARVLVVISRTREKQAPLPIDGVVLGCGIFEMHVFRKIANVKIVTFDIVFLVGVILNATIVTFNVVLGVVTFSRVVVAT